MRHFRVLALTVLLLLIGARSVSALQADEIALVVNKNVPTSMDLARFYAQQRNIPDGRIIALDLPFPLEQMPFRTYDLTVVPAVRDFLTSNHLDKKVTCLVTFWGVPLRIERRVTAASDKEELAEIDRLLKSAQADLENAVITAEKFAVDLQPGFRPEKGTHFPELAQRAQVAVQAAMRHILATQDATLRRERFNQIVQTLQKLSGQFAGIEHFPAADLTNLSLSPLSPQEIKAQQAEAKALRREFAEIQEKTTDAAAREQARNMSKEHFGLFQYAKVLTLQKTLLETKETESAFDSELALLWWKPYPRQRWLVNPLHYRAGKAQDELPPTLMVMRLDAPAPRMVQDIITTSIDVERKGLNGLVAIDSRGVGRGNAYGKYDQTLRDLAALVSEKTKLGVVLDEKEALFQPDSLKGVAIYCGWYSLRNYIPAFQFNPGAVGFHIASKELVSLHARNERGWVAGLLNDGVVASVGPVAEPYLQSFPNADEFFPLLMTGKLTLAEVYWKTTPMTSWMNTCIGDPLYTPYKTNPPLQVDDLPDRLRLIFSLSDAAAAN